MSNEGPRFKIQPRRDCRYTSQIHRDWIDKLMDEDELIKELSTKEIDFIEQMDTLLKAGRQMSPAQEEWLERIYAEKTA